jgi:hypothetical protein
MSDRLKLRVAFFNSEKENTLRLEGRSVKLGYCVLLIDSALISETFTQLKSEPERASRSVEVVLKDRIDVDMVIGSSFFISLCKKGRHLIACLSCGARADPWRRSLLCPGEGSSDPGSAGERGDRKIGRLWSAS